MSPAVGEVYEDRNTPGRRAKVEDTTAYGYATMRTTQHPNPRAIGRRFYTAIDTLARQWVRVDTTEDAS